MRIKNIDFITPYTYVNNKVVLSKSYSQTLTLQDGSIVNLSSNVGIRENQEDCLAVSENNGYVLLLVADGMGGLAKGEEASFHVSSVIKSWFESLSIDNLGHLHELYIDDKLTTIIKLMQEKILPPNCGTTLNMSIIGPKKTFIVNIGDSRVYSIKNKNIELITRDDSMAFIMYHPRTSNQRDALRFYKDNNIISNCITTGYLPVIVTKEIKNEEYDILCHVTDGVSDILAEKQINRYSQSKTPAQKLVESAVTSKIVYNDFYLPYDEAKFAKCISPKDNATALVYTKKRK